MIASATRRPRASTIVAPASSIRRNLGSWSSELYCLSHDASLDPQQVFLAHRAFGEQAEARFGTQLVPHANDRDPGRRLRVGVVSGDFRDHPVARFLEPVWRELDPAQVQLFAYDTDPAADATAHAPAHAGRTVDRRFDAFRRRASRRASAPTASTYSSTTPGTRPGIASASSPASPLRCR